CKSQHGILVLRESNSLVEHAVPLPLEFPNRPTRLHALDLVERLLKLVVHAGKFQQVGKRQRCEELCGPVFILPIESCVFLCSLLHCRKGEGPQIGRRCLPNPPLKEARLCLAYLPSQKARRCLAFRKLRPTEG